MRPFSLLTRSGIRHIRTAATTMIVIHTPIVLTSRR